MVQQVLTRYYTEQEQSRLLGTVKKLIGVFARRDYHWMGLLRVTGMRIGELANFSCHAARFALEQDWIHIPAGNRKGWRRKGQKKVVRREHSFPIGKEAREHLKALLAIHVEMGGQALDQDKLVLSRQGAMSRRSFQDRFEMWCKAAGVPIGSPHWMRHTRAMNLMRKSKAADPRGVVGGMLGHASIASTGVYTGITKEDLVAAVRQADGAPRLRRYQVRKAFEAGRA